ncbi:MAG TPA: nicotinamide riboside transporter PnuC [Xanthomonadales bacterium]|nr:nicotinamide riboside transporter PnuC [Xanthomonadales bacterium]
MPELTLQQAWEALAVVLAVAYLLLAIRQNAWCWAAAAISTSLYLFIMYESKLYMQSLLQLYYLAMAAYGWYNWRRPQATGGHLPVTVWPLRYHALAVGGVLLLVFLSAGLLQRYSDAALPYLDAFTAWGAIVATFLMARKILENWLYWFVIDTVSIGLYLDRELYFTAGLFVFYLVMIVVGYRSWRGSIPGQAA